MNDDNEKYTDHYLIGFEEAIKLLLENTAELASETIPLERAIGRIVSAPMVCSSEVPSFNNAAMDGFAISHTRLLDASPDVAIELPIAGTSAAGASEAEDENGLAKAGLSAWKVMTGAPVPKHYDTVIPIEQCVLNSNHVSFTDVPMKGANIRQAGEDFSIDSPLLEPGQQIGANQVMALASQGINQVPVFKPISIAVFSTGKELVDDFNQPLKFGQIRNSNKPYILEWLREYPVEVSDRGTNHDDAQKFEQDIASELLNDTKVIVSTGAVSMGDFDFVPSIINKLGGKILFHKVKIRPGKPILFAKFNNGSYFFGLPGNPISTAIGLRFFVYALLRKFWCLHPEQPMATLSRSTFQKKPGFRFFLKASTAINEHAQMTTTILNGQESFKVSPLLSADGWAIVPETEIHIEAGDRISFFPTHPGD